MRSLSALVLLTVAVGAGAGVYYLPDIDADGTLGLGRAAVADATGRVPTSTPVSSPPIATSAIAPADAAGRVYSAQTPLYGRADVPAPTVKPKAIRAEKVAEAAIVSGEPIMRAGGGVTHDTRGTSPAAADPTTRADNLRSFALDLHRELKRVGCYSGDVTGEWTAASKKAMKAFLERVNARLPVETPDHILLTLVKGHASEACGRGCPSGQANDEDGKCVPRGLLVKAPVREPQRSATGGDQVPSGLPKSQERTPDRVMLSSSWTTEVAPITSDVVTPLARAAANVGSQSGAAVLPGRMTLGAAPTVPGLPAGSPVTTGSTAGAQPYAPTLIQPPRPVQSRIAAATQDTPNAAAGSQSTTGDAYAANRGRRPANAGTDRPDVAPRPVPQVIYPPRPQANPQRQVIVQRSYSGGVSTYVTPTYRPAPNRDWKQTVFNRDLR